MSVGELAQTALCGQRQQARLHEVGVEVEIPAEGTAFVQLSEIAVRSCCQVLILATRQLWPCCNVRVTGFLVGRDSPCISAVVLVGATLSMRTEDVVHRRTAPNHARTSVFGASSAVKASF